MPEPTPLSDVLRKIQKAVKSGFRLKEPFSLWVQGFFPVPVEALRDPGLKPMHLLVLGLACRFSMKPADFQLFASQEYLARLFGVTNRYIRRILGDLVRLGYLEVQRRAHGRHNVYLVSDRIPESRRELLRDPHPGLEFQPGRPRDRNNSSAQTPLTGTEVPVGTTKEVYTRRERATLCLEYSPLKKKAESLVKSGMSPPSALTEALRLWRESLSERQTPEALAKRLRYLGIRAKVARAITGSSAPSIILTAARKLNRETKDPAGAFIWHVNKLLGSSRPARGP